jgi:O-acetylhomoserine (thiol)-lyase
MVVVGDFPWGETLATDILGYPDPAYGSVIWRDKAQLLGVSAFELRFRYVLLRDLGPTLSPNNAHLLLLGVSTLPLRMREHVAHAEIVARFLRTHPKVEQVFYAQDDTPDLRTGMISFILRGGVSAGEQLIQRLRLFRHVANNGDIRSLAIHPASTMERQLTPGQISASGTPPGLVRLSIGLEDATDLVADLEQALHG